MTLNIYRQRSSLGPNVTSYRHKLVRRVCDSRPNLSVPSISDQILQASGLTEEELTLEIAVALYQREILSLGKAAELANLHRMAFQTALSERQVPVNYGPDDLEADMATLDRVLPS